MLLIVIGGWQMANVDLLLGFQLVSANWYHRSSAWTTKVVGDSVPPLVFWRYVGVEPLLACPNEQQWQGNRELLLWMSGYVDQVSSVSGMACLEGGLWFIVRQELLAAPYKRENSESGFDGVTLPCAGRSALCGLFFVVSGGLGRSS